VAGAVLTVLTEHADTVETSVDGHVGATFDLTRRAERE
jgi:hypothetical protein